MACTRLHCNDTQSVAEYVLVSDFERLREHQIMGLLPASTHVKSTTTGIPVVLDSWILHKHTA